MKTLTMTTKEVKAFLKENGFDLNVKKLDGSCKGHYMITARKNKETGQFQEISSEKFIEFLNKNFLHYDYYNRGVREFTKYSFNGGLSVDVQNHLTLQQ